MGFSWRDSAAPENPPFGGVGGVGGVRVRAAARRRRDAVRTPPFGGVGGVRVRAAGAMRRARPHSAVRRVRRTGLFVERGRCRAPVDRGFFSVHQIRRDRMVSTRSEMRGKLSPAQVAQRLSASERGVVARRRAQLVRLEAQVAEVKKRLRDAEADMAAPDPAKAKRARQCSKAAKDLRRCAVDRARAAAAVPNAVVEDEATADKEVVDNVVADEATAETAVVVEKEAAEATAVEKMPEAVPVAKPESVAAERGASDAPSVVYRKSTKTPPSLSSVKRMFREFFGDAVALKVSRECQGHDPEMVASAMLGLLIDRGLY